MPGCPTQVVPGSSSPQVQGVNNLGHIQSSAHPNGCRDPQFVTPENGYKYVQVHVSIGSYRILFSRVHRQRRNAVVRRMQIDS